MEKVVQIQQLLLRARRLPLLVLGLTLAILAAAIVLTTIQVRANIREQIAGRTGEVLYAVALMEYENAQEAAEGVAGDALDPATQLTVVLKTSKLKGVMGTRLFDVEGRFVESFPPEVREGKLPSRDLAALRELRPVGHFLPAVALSEFFYPEAMKSPSPATPVPMLIVTVPLHTSPPGRLAGSAQFLLEGNSIAAEFARLDRHLALQALGTFAVGGGILVLVIGGAFRRLRRMHRALAERTNNLIKANQELALSAKTSALGAVTAHLIHGLKNPLAGLQNFMADRNPVPDDDQESDWEQAAASTRRMQTMINDVVSLLREEQTGIRYEISLAELGEIVAGRVQPQAHACGVVFTMQFTTAGVLPNRAANLVALILVNLVENGLEATSRGKAVCLSVIRSGERIVFEVRDEGTGFPAGQTPFDPGRSTKEGGSGIGLAVCKQLANHLGAGLELKSSTANGCVFALNLPAEVCVETAGAARLAHVG